MNKVIILFVSLLAMLLSIDTLAMTCPAGSEFTKYHSHTWLAGHRWYWSGFPICDEDRSFNRGFCFVSKTRATTQDREFSSNVKLDVWIPLEIGTGPSIVCAYDFSPEKVIVEYGSISQRVDYQQLNPSQWIKGSPDSYIIWWSKGNADHFYHCQTTATAPEACSFSMY